MGRISEEKIISEAEELGIKIPHALLRYINEEVEERENMIELIRKRGVKSKRVLFAMRVIPRHIFVSPELAHLAYSDNPLPIGKGQTISQPFITALMTEKLEISGGEKILEVGTGSGYHTAILGLLGRRVITVEYERELSESAERKLRTLGFRNIRFVVGDGSLGFPDEAPYQRICVSAASPEPPPPLISQLDRNGIMVIPIGDEEMQILSKIIRTEDGKGFVKEKICECRFVKLRGQFGFGS